MTTDDVLARIEACIPALRRYAWALLRNRDTADDLVHDAVVRGLDKLNTRRDDADIRAWLFTIMHNLFVSQFRRRKARPDTGSLDDTDESAMSMRPVQEDRLAWRDLLRGLEQLPEGRAKAQAFGNFSQSWARSDRKAALAWAQQLPEGQQKDRALRSIVGFDWAEKDPKAAAEVLEVLKKHTKGLTDQELSELYERLTGPGGLHKGAAINLKGVETVLKLRSIYGGGKSTLMNPLKYVDLSYSERAHQEK